MKITLVMVNPNMSGGDRVCAIYAKLLSERGHIVNVIAPRKKFFTIKDQLKRLIKGKGLISKKEQSKNHFNLLGVPYTHTLASSPLKEAETPDADVIIATWWETAEWIKDFSDSKGKKYYFIQHHEVHEGQPVKRVKNTYKLPFHQITIANWLVTLMEGKYESKSVSLVPNSVDHHLFYAQERKKNDIPVLGFLFSETKFKGTDIALDVITSLKKDIPELRVIAFGAKPPACLELPEYVELSVNPEQDKIRLLYQQCDLWLCCSRSEGFGLTILEAMACRTPAVSTRCGGPEDIIVDGNSGFLCDLNNVPMIVDRAKQILISDNLKWSCFSESAHRKATGYTWNDAASLFEKAISSNE